MAAARPTFHGRSGRLISTKMTSPTPSRVTVAQVRAWPMSTESMRRTVS